MADGIDLKLKISGANKTQRELKQTGKASKKMGRDMKGANAAGAGMGSMMAGLPALLNPVVLAAAAAAVAMAAMTGGVIGLAAASKKYITDAIKLSETLDAIAKKAKNLGESGEEMQVVIGALELAGVGADASMKAFTKLGKILGDEMVKGPGAAKDALKLLGLTAEELDQMKLGDKMLAIASGMEPIESQSERNAIASALFGKAGADLLEAFKDRDALEAAIVDMERFGVASNESLRDSEALQDGILRQKKAWERMKREALTPLIPTLTGIMNGLAEVMLSIPTKDIKDFGAAFADAMVTGVVVTAKLGQVLENNFLMTRILFEGLMAVGYATAGQFTLAGQSIVSATKHTASFSRDILAVGERWGGWSATIVAEIDKARTAAALLVDTDLEPRRLGPPKGGKGKDALAGQLAALAKEREAFRESQKSETQILEEAVATREAIIDAARKRGAEKGGMTEQQAVVAGTALWDWANQERQRLRDEDLAAAQKAADAEYAIAKKVSDEILADAEELAANLEIERQGTIAATVAGIDAVGSFAAMISDTMAATGADQTEEGKRAAKALFLVTQSAALASAIVNTAVAVSAGLANPPGPPYSIPQAVAAGIMGGVQIATIVGTTIGGLADAGLPPGALRQAGLNNHSLIAMRNDEMVLDPVGTAAISRMLEQRGSANEQPIEVRTTLELDGHVLGQVVDAHLIRSAERGTDYQNRIRYGAR